MSSDKKENSGEFKLSTASVKNRKTVYLVIMILLLGGISAYQNLSRESFPEVQIPKIFVNVPYPGNSPDIVRDKIIKPIEKELNNLKGVEKIEANALQDMGYLIVEFDFSVSSKEAKDLVTDAVTDAKSDKNFATDLPYEPTIQELDVNDMPVVNINLSGDFPIEVLNAKAEYLQDKIEALAEINEVDIRGVQDQKLKIEVKQDMAESKMVSVDDIEAAISRENVNVGAGSLKIDGVEHFVMLEGKFTTVDEIQNMVVKHDGDKDVYMYEVANVSFGDADTTSYARENDLPVVMLDVKKRAGANIINAIDQIKDIVNDAKDDGTLAGINVSFTNDQSDKIRSQVSNLENSIILGVILVVGVLLFFLGLRNALFVGVAIPLSMFMSFMLLHAAGVTLNVMVLFSLVLALGMLVDNGIVVVENVYRLMDEGYDGFQAAIKGVGEVAWPIIASTATTLAAFVPLAIWPGTMGEFMKFLPITLMIVLGSSLFVALVINPVLTAVMMKLKEEDKKLETRDFIVVIAASVLSLAMASPQAMIVGGIGYAILIGYSLFRFVLHSKDTAKTFSLIPAVIIIGFAFLHYMMVSLAAGNGLMLVGGFILFNRFYSIPVTDWFQNKALPKMENGYRNALAWIMNGKRPIWVFSGTFGILILSFVLIAKFPTETVFFPDNEPNYVNIYIEYPVGTDIEVTNNTTKEIKQLVDEVLNEEVENSGEHKINWKADTYTYNSVYNLKKVKDAGGEIHYDTVPFISSVLEQVGAGAGKDRFGGSANGTPHKSKITIKFSEFEHRKGLNTSIVKKKIEDKIHYWNGNIADLKILVDKEEVGPPTQDPIYIEVTGSENYDLLVEAATEIKKFINAQQIDGMQKVDTDVKISKAEFRIIFDRVKLRTSGMSFGQVASTIRTALFGKDVSTFEKGDEIYDLNIRFEDEFRGDIDALLNQKIMFRNNRGQFLTVPIMSVVKDYEIVYKNTSIRREDMENMVIASAGVEEGANGNNLVKITKEKMVEFEKSDVWQKYESQGIKYKFGGEMEEQQKEMSFLTTALLIAVFLILLIIVMQFNSYSTPLIIVMSVVLSLAGVFLGIVIGRNPFVIMMTMIGIISLAGIVVNNAIVLIDYTNLLRTRRKEELGMTDEDQLSIADVKEAIITGGQTRLRPVLLTAITTILGLIPMATGMNLDFYSLMSDLDPKIYFGGDNAMFFGPMSVAIIYGLTFATFLTLIVVPVMYYLLFRLKLWFYRVSGWQLREKI
ncbi:efflux RND transporter permease subunit [Parvicella tangerina]|uniref:Multidrug resistance protein MdtC n=1 Tax=Parvicella tangerina TaxID=2829795 RepID=A0A916NFF0_9FLAO|nr:efflux RND transporter permease subunit [Parvicella tangerina]CAG5078402.1 Multidrug resistance protein MdtC [Parvicella tangerina]